MDLNIEEAQSLFRNGPYSHKRRDSRF